MLTLAFFIFCILSPTIGLTQSPYFHQFTDGDGLPSMTIYDIIQDKQGYIWLGTDAGLCSYDGYEFKLKEVPSSKGKAFHEFQQDKDGRIYFRNFNDQLFYLYHDKVQEIALPESNQKISKKFRLDEQGNIWLIGDAWHAYSPKTKAWRAFPLPQQGEYRVITSNNKSNIGIFNNQEVYLYQQSTQDFRRLRKFDTARIFSCIWPDELFLATLDREVYRYDFRREEWLFVTTFPDIVTGIKQDSQKNYWFFTPKGLHFVEARKPRFEEKRHFLRNRFVSQMLEDKEGNLWLTTIGSGLFLVPNKDLINFNAKNSPLKFEQVNCLAEDAQHRVLLGTNGNKIYVLNTRGQVHDAYALPTGDVECLFYDKKRQKLWVENRDLLMIDLPTGKTEKKVSAGFTPKSMSLFRDENLIVAAGDAAYVLNMNEEMVLDSNYRNSFELVRKDLLKLRNVRSRASITENQRRRFWVAYADGLYYYENAKEREIRTPKGKAIIATCLAEDKGNIWVGTSQQGVFLIKNKKIARHLHQENTLISNFCRVIAIADDQLYIGTNKGLQIYHLKANISRIFNKQDGLQSNEIKDILLQKEQIYLATSAGLSVINKELSATNPNPPLIYITGFKIGEKTQKVQAGYVLDYDQNDLKIEFTGISFRSIGKFKYKYRLLGLNTKWIEIESAINFVRYASLPPGKYEFQVKALNEDGIESTKTASIKISIAHPYWQKWWFISLMLLLGLGIVSAIFVNRIRAIRRQNELEKALQKANLSALKLQMNPHFIFNAISAIQYYMSNPSKAREASRYLAKFAKLIRKVLVSSRQEYISLDQEINLLEDYLSLQNLIQEKPFSYQIKVDKAIEQESLAIPPMFAQPIIENAIEHGIQHLKNEEGKIDINFNLSLDYIVLEISDNGVGFSDTEIVREKSNTEESLASKITRERIAAFQKSTKRNIKYDTISLEQGTKVIFHLPYKVL